MIWLFRAIYYDKSDSFSCLIDTYFSKEILSPLSTTSLNFLLISNTFSVSLLNNTSL